jgi:serine/threonine-protein kinase
MRTICLAGLALALTVTAADARRLEKRSTDPQRQGIASVLPPDWILQPTDPNGHRKDLTSPDGRASLTVLEERADTNMVPYMRSVAERDGERVTYQRRGRGWIVSSGFKGDRIFYRKAMLACGDTVWHQIAFEYPAAEKRAYDRFVTRTEKALAAHRQDRCPTARR